MSQSQLTKFEQGLLKTARLDVMPKTGITYHIDFQFPPKIISETNSMEWKTKDQIMASGPFVIQMGAHGRSLEVEWEYIATDNKFTPKFIAEMLRKLKSYHFEFEFPGKHLPVVAFKYTEILPEEIKFRITALNITYGPEMIAQGGGYYPLYSKAAISIIAATQLGSQNRPAIQKFAKNLASGPKPEWY